MGLVAIFALQCCHKEIVFGRFKGDPMAQPSLSKCPFGCPEQSLPTGKPKRFDLAFVRYESEEKLTPELLATWKFPDQTSARLCQARLERQQFELTKTSKERKRKA